MNCGVVLVIPAHRPSHELPEILSQVLLHSDGCVQHVVVVNDGSGSESEETFRRIGGIAGVTVLTHDGNLGQGAALKTGFQHALTAFPTAVGIVAADADSQHAPADIVRVAQTLSENPDTIVLGAREFGASVPPRSRIGNLITRRVFRVLTGRRISDTQTGLRGWPRAACLRNLHIKMNGFDFQLECLLRAEAPIVEIPIQTIYLDRNQSSHFNPVSDSIRIYFLFLRYCASSLFAAGVDAAVFYPVLLSTGNLAASQIAGRAAGGLVSFFVMKHLVFRSADGLTRTLGKYVMLLAASGLMSFVMMQFLHTRLALPMPLAKIIAEALLFLGNFVMQRDLIFSLPFGEAARARRIDGGSDSPLQAFAPSTTPVGGSELGSGRLQ